MSARSRSATTACPRCGAALSDGQAWCVECGLAARTELITTTAWRRLILLAIALAAAALVALAAAFGVLTKDDNVVPPATPTAPAAP